MKATVFHENGDASVLSYEDYDTPKPAEDEVLVKVSACGLNHLDIWLRNGIPSYTPPMPHISGCDISGWVEETGTAAGNWKKDDRVIISPGVSCDNNCEMCKSGNDNLCDDYKIFGAGTQGGYAEYTIAKGRDLLAIPESVSDEDAAAFPLTFVTAWHMLTTRAGLKKGERLLVIGGSSGVGSAAIQMGKHIGCEVYTTVGNEEKADIVRSMGVDGIIDHSKDRIRDKVNDLTDGKGVNVVLEHVGGEIFTEGLASLAKNGRLVTCGATTGNPSELDLRFIFMRQLSIFGSIMGTRKELEEVLKLVAEHKLRPVIDRTVPLSEAAQAQTWMEERSHFGKILLLPEG